MEPIPETIEAVEEYGPFVDGDLLAMLQERARLVRALVPTCVGMSVATREHDVTFTLVATDSETAALDAVQYLDGGPCVEAAERSAVVELGPDQLLDEDRWHLFARATATFGVAASLTLPVVQHAHVIGTVNLYATRPDAFLGHHEALAGIFDAWAAGAITNADLGFTTRQQAELAPTTLREEYTISVATGILAGRHDTDIETARRSLSDAARRAGVSDATFAGFVVDFNRRKNADG